MKSYTANALNQYTSIVAESEFVPEFDDDGNQTLVKTSTGIWHITYNAENRPVVWSNATAVVAMDYDRMGRRVWYKSISGTQTNAFSKFVYDGYLCVQRLDGFTGEVEQEYAWDPTETVATRPLKWTLTDLGRTFCYFHDGNKNVSDVIDASDATLVAHYDYAPFGAVTVATGPMADANPYRFSSEYHDAALGCVTYNYRHYNPLDGRWMNRDPFGEASDYNVYSSFINNPAVRYDVFGLSSQEEDCKRKIANALNYYYVKISINQLENKGCEIPPVKCKCCDPGWGGFYNPPYLFWGNSIHMCYNNFSSQDVYNTILEHEFIHAVQTCYDEKEDDKCKTSVCKEIEAYYTSNCFHYPTSESRRICVWGGVRRPSANHCKTWFGYGSPDNARIDRYFLELYERCKERSRY